MTHDTNHDNRTATASPFGDLSTMFEQLKLPGVDMSLVVEARRRDIEALLEANKTAFEAMQALARTQTEMLTQAMTGMQEAAGRMVSSGAKAGPAEQAEGTRNIWQKMLADMKGIAEMAQKTQADALAGMTKQATQRMQELQQSALPK